MLIKMLAALAAALLLIVWDPLHLFDKPRTSLGRAIAWIRDRMVEDAANFWRWWSVRFNAAGIAILSWVSFDPVSALGVWNMMPPTVRAVLPAHFVTYAGLALFALGMLARVVKQKPKG